MLHRYFYQRYFDHIKRQISDSVEKVGVKERWKIYKHDEDSFQTNTCAKTQLDREKDLIL